MVLAVVARSRVPLSSSSRASLVVSLAEAAEAAEAAVGAATSSTSIGVHNRDFDCQQYEDCCREGSRSKSSRAQWTSYSHMSSSFRVLKTSYYYPQIFCLSLSSVCLRQASRRYRRDGICCSSRSSLDLPSSYAVPIMSS